MDVAYFGRPLGQPSLFVNGDDVDAASAGFISATSSAARSTSVSVDPFRWRVTHTGVGRLLSYARWRCRLTRPHYSSKPDQRDASIGNEIGALFLWLFQKLFHT